VKHKSLCASRSTIASFSLYIYIYNYFGLDG
jgi:hypothetical protein